MFEQFQYQASCLVRNFASLPANITAIIVRGSCYMSMAECDDVFLPQVPHISRSGFAGEAWKVNPQVLLVKNCVSLKGHMAVESTYSTLL